MRLNVMSICQVFRGLALIRSAGLTRPGNWYFGAANGSLEAGLCKSLLPRPEAEEGRKESSKEEDSGELGNEETHDEKEDGIEDEMGD